MVPALILALAATASIFTTTNAKLSAELQQMIAMNTEYTLTTDELRAGAQAAKDVGEIIVGISEDMLRLVDAIESPDVVVGVPEVQQAIQELKAGKKAMEVLIEETVAYVIDQLTGGTEMVLNNRKAMLRELLQKAMSQ